ncbi:MAG: conjugal transfer protein TrbC [Alphaproteobacteria bacterium HGW-Alphaproteobacteria-18]|nr:MAG: conjugal transfer protein TrbC [Alphaproteobacteria bacterium HGW-Alphaproteobacteria-18]
MNHHPYTPARIARKSALLILLTALAAAPAFAAGSGMPWETPLQQVVESITGPVARAAAVIGIVLAGIAIMFSEGGGGVRKLAFVGLGIAIMFAAVSFFLDFFGFAGGAVL